MTDTQQTCPAELPNWCAQRHWAIFWILILCSLAVVTGRVITVGNGQPKEGMPFFSANDRSRWCTVRALGDNGVYEIDAVIAGQTGRKWDSIDKVRHLGADGQLHYYSSKPPLFPTLVAWNYKILNSLTGWEIATESVLVVRVLLLIVNVIPWGIYLWFVARMINRIPVRDWTRYFVLACAGFGTFLTVFTVSLNNHLPAAVCAMMSLYLMSEMFRKKNLPWYYFASVGLFSAFVVANELPALAFFACATLVALIHSWQKTVLAFVPAAAVVAVAFFGTNFVAHGQWKPAYAMRGDGAAIVAVTGDFTEALDAGTLPVEIHESIPQELKFKRPTVESGAWPSTPSEVRRWVVRDEITAAQIAILSSDQEQFELRRWGNWYDYPTSYWLSSNDHKKSEVDRGQESMEVYTFHVLFGHHGIFSLTPIWLLSLSGMIALLFGAKMGGSYQMRWLGAMGLTLSIVVITFYVTRPAIDRNYGGFACCLRWLLWLVPIWLMTMLPVVDWLAKSRWGKALCFALLFISAVSAIVPANNPWTLPWLYQIWDLTGLPR
jgi:hypothetical protein